MRSPVTYKNSLFFLNLNIIEFISFFLYNIYIVICITAEGQTKRSSAASIIFCYIFYYLCEVVYFYFIIILYEEERGKTRGSGKGKDIRR